MQKPLIKWSAEAISDLKSIYYNLLKRNSLETALKIRNEIFVLREASFFLSNFRSMKFIINTEE